MLIPFPKQNHYRTYMKIYGSMLMYLADTNDEALKKFILGKDLDGVLLALHKQIEQAEMYE